MPSGWDLECTDVFVSWWNELTAVEQEAVAHDIEVLAAMGPHLGRPLVDTVSGSRFANMKELRTRVGSSQFRVLFAFDRRRVGLLLLGGDKASDQRWYERHIPIADRILTAHLDDLAQATGD